VGEFSPAPLLLDFDARVRLEFRGATITSDAGLLALRELDDALGLTRRATEFLSDTRTGLNISHQFAALLRQSLPSRIAGYDDLEERLVKTGARLVRHARQLTMQTAEAAVPRRVWHAMVRTIGELRSG
jgi:hypothetical protein